MYIHDGFSPLLLDRPQLTNTQQTNLFKFSLNDWKKLRNWSLTNSERWNELEKKENAPSSAEKKENAPRSTEKKENAPSSAQKKENAPSSAEEKENVPSSAGKKTCL